LNDNKTAINLIKRSKLVLFTSGFCLYSVIIGCIPVLLYTFGSNLSLYDFLIFGILWTIFYPFYCYFSCSAAYWLPAYYYIVCYYFKLRFNSIQNKLKNLIFQEKSSNLRKNLIIIKQILKEHNDLCQRIDSYNKYWRKHLTITSLTFIIEICFLSYVVFIAPMYWSLQLEFALLLYIHILIVLVLTYSASTVSHFNYTIFRDFNSVYAKFDFPVSIKLRVSFKSLIILFV